MSKSISICCLLKHLAGDVDYTMVRRQAHWKARTHYVLLYVAYSPT
jgi:hypothetical protein